MPFISKEERKQRIEKLQSADVGKRTFVLISLILIITYTIFIFIMQMLPLFPFDFESGIRHFLGNGEWVKIVESTETSAHEAIITTYGWIMIIATITFIVMLIVSFFIFLSMRSLRWGFKETIDLMTTPIPGKAGKFAGSKAKKIVEKRISVATIHKNDKKKKK